MYRKQNLTIARRIRNIYVWISDVLLHSFTNKNYAKGARVEFSDEITGNPAWFATDGNQRVRERTGAGRTNRKGQNRGDLDPQPFWLKPLSNFCSYSVKWLS